MGKLQLGAAYGSLYALLHHCLPMAVKHGPGWCTQRIDSWVPLNGLFRPQLLFPCFSSLPPEPTLASLVEAA